MKQADLFPSQVEPSTLQQITCWSLWQPYAGLVACGLKPLETRLFPWPVKARPYPHTLLICSTAKPDSAAWERLQFRIPDEHHKLCMRLGVALALVDVIGCRELTAEDEPLSWYWDPEEKRKGIARYAWQLANVRRLGGAPWRVKGGQGFSKSITVDMATADLR